MAEKKKWNGRRLLVMVEREATAQQLSALVRLRDWALVAFSHQAFSSNLRREKRVTLALSKERTRHRMIWICNGKICDTSPTVTVTLSMIWPFDQKLFQSSRFVGLSTTSPSDPRRWPTRRLPSRRRRRQ